MTLQVGVKGLIRNDRGQYLFIQRASQLQTGERDIWDIPGGRLAVDEDISLVDALRREVHEETGLSITVEPHLLCAQDILRPEADLHVIRLTYTIDASGDPQLSSEHRKSAWLPLKDALVLNTDRYLAAALRMLPD